MRLNRLERFLVRVTTWDALDTIALVLAVVIFVALIVVLSEAPKP